VKPGSLVLDTSVIAKWFLPEPLSDRADRILEDVRLGKLHPAAPDLIVYEFANILWQRQKKGEISRRQGDAIMSDFERLPINLAPGDVLGSQSLEEVAATGCTAYDGAFIALADSLETKLVTADRRLISRLAHTRFSRTVLWLGDWPTD